VKRSGEPRGVSTLSLKRGGRDWFMGGHFSSQPITLKRRMREKEASEPGKEKNGLKTDSTSMSENPRTDELRLSGGQIGEERP